MSILNFDQRQHEEALDNARQNMDDLDVEMVKSYNSLLLLGNNLNANDPDLLEIAIFNIRLCYVYFSMKEDYEKLAELKRLAEMIEEGKPSLVDKTIIDSITINLN